MEDQKVLELVEVENIEKWNYCPDTSGNSPHFSSEDIKENCSSQHY